jgi:class 3 adenylate cyclase
MVKRNAGLPPERRIEFRVGSHFGDTVEEADCDLISEGANMAARLAEQARDAGRRSPHLTLSGGSVLLVVADAAAQIADPGHQAHLRNWSLVRARFWKNVVDLSYYTF